MVATNSGKIIKGMFSSVVLSLYKPFFEGAIGDGCTACVALVTRDRIIVGNAGDSRCVLSRNVQAIPLSIDHKPILPAETQRIVVAVHEIIVNPGRGSIPHVDDGIAISRAIGDLRYKGKPCLGPQHQVVTASPEAHSEQMTHNDEFLVIACDEIWDCMTNQEWVDYVRLHLKNDLELWRIRESLLSHCLAQLKGRTYLSYRLGSRNPRKRPTTWRRPPWGLVLQRATAPRSAPGPPTCCRPRWDLVHQHPARTVRSGPLTADLGAADAGRVDVPKLQRSSSSGP